MISVYLLLDFLLWLIVVEGFDIKDKSITFVVYYNSSTLISILLFNNNQNIML